MTAVYNGLSCTDSISLLAESTKNNFFSGSSTQNRIDWNAVLAQRRAAQLTYYIGITLTQSTGLKYHSRKEITKLTEKYQT